MFSSLTDYQKKKIKELVDQIIVNHGILPPIDGEISVDGLNGLQLSRLAFRYYKMIYTNQSPLDINPKMPNLETGKTPADLRAGRYCLGCDALLTDSDDQMPVCRKCRHQLKADYEMLKTILK